MKAEIIQTLHPDPTKTNKKITVAKYELIKTTLLEVLLKGAHTHTELMQALYERLSDSFEGKVLWYGETVKLDLEARKLIERTNDKPQKYRVTII